MDHHPSDQSPPLEEAVVRVLPWLLGGLAGSFVVLVLPKASTPMPTFLAHLSLLTLFGVLAGWQLTDMMGRAWYRGYRLAPVLRRLAAGVSLMVVVTGLVGLVTLASSAALQYAPSVQFLQLLSALDIAWVVAATLIGAGRIWGRRIGLAAAVGMGGICVGSIANYLRVVGFSSAGEWLVDGGELLRLVIPFDVVAGVLAATLLVVAARQP